MQLSEDIALVTGASRGIGQAIAWRLGKLGAKVVGTATTESGANAIQENFAKQEIEGVGLQLDVTSTDSIESLMQQIKETYGAPTILVNNAGITRDNLLMRMKDDEWEDVINTNLSSVFRLSKASRDSFTA